MFFISPPTLPCRIRVQRTLAGIVQSRLDDSIKGTLVTLAAILRPDSNITPTELAADCQKVVRWAEWKSWPQTAIAYAQAAALLLPRNPEYAYIVGRLCRGAVQYARAESWFRRAIILALNVDSRFYARAWMGLGSLYLARGDHGAARDAYIRALRRARRARLADVRAEAIHDLFGLAVEAHQFEEAALLVRRAFRAYAPTHPRFPALGHDVASFWMIQGYFGRALSVYKAVLPLIERPAERLLVLSHIARAAAGAGDLKAFADAWVDAWQMIDGNRKTDCLAPALLNLAHGSVQLGDWERAELTAEFARDMGKQRREQQVVAEAESILDAVAHQQKAVREIAPEAGAETEVDDALAAAFIRRLGGCAGATGDSPHIPC